MEAKQVKPAAQLLRSPAPAPCCVDWLMLIDLIYRTGHVGTVVFFTLFTQLGCWLGL